eukprot:scaffold78450_cov49-Cyclotella_meneghiniana.AAC.1
MTAYLAPAINDNRWAINEKEVFSLGDIWTYETWEYTLAARILLLLAVEADLGTCVEFKGVLIQSKI